MENTTLFTRPLLAVIKGALVELESHSTMTLLLEKYGFDHNGRPDFSNKINRASSFLDHQDWKSNTNTQGMLELLSEMYLKYQHLLEHDDQNSNNAIHAMKTMDKALKGSSINWIGSKFELGINSHFTAVQEFDGMDLNHIRIEIERARGSATHDPADAMTAAENIVVATCKGILKEYDKAYSPRASPQQLLSEALECLNILPKDISENARGSESAVKTLRSMGAAIQGLSELRNLYGDAHGKAPGFRGLEGRHARLMVGLAEAISVFLVETGIKKGTKGS